jgi:GDP-4-dehydro-6-deoxy-D-mannose reductase
LAEEHGLRIHVVRPFNLLGPGLSRHYFAQALCERLRQLHQAGKFGVVPVANAQASRDWVDVRDVAEAIFRLAFCAPPQPGRIGLYNIASGIETSVLALADQLCRLAGDFRAVAGEPRTGRTEIDRSCGDSRRLRQATGWQPLRSWHDSLRDMWLELDPCSHFP